MLRVARMDILEDIVLTVSDGGDFYDLPLVLRDRMTGELAERPLGATHVREHFAFDDHLGIGRHQNGYGLGLYEAQRLVHHAADDAVLVFIRWRQRLSAELKERMNADDDSDWQGLVAALE